jgi:hypothetical protein
MATSDSLVIKKSDWGYAGAVALVIVAGVFRKEIIRMVLRLLMRAVPAQKYKTFNSAVREFEKLVLYPLSFVIFMLFLWGAFNIMGLLTYVGVNSAITVIMGIPVLLTVVQFCKFLNIVRHFDVVEYV